MTAVTQTLATVTVRDTANSLSRFLSGFDRRLANHAGSATFITREEIDKREDLANCALQVAVDGQLKEWGFAVNSIPPKEVHGIEIYPGAATIPAEYASMRRDASCGLIMIWTRRVK